MSKRYTYLEAIRELFTDKDKRFKEETGEIMFFNKGTDSLNIRVGAGYTIEELIINDNWINSKWALAEEKKKYNVRVYSVTSNKLISSEIVVMTKEEIENYRKELFNKGKVEKDIKSGIGEGIVLFKINKYEHEIVSEELITN